MVGWHHRLNGHEFEQALGDGKASAYSARDRGSIPGLGRSPRGGKFISIPGACLFVHMLIFINSLI